MKTVGETEDRTACVANVPCMQERPFKQKYDRARIVGVGGGGASERFTGKSFLARPPPPSLPPASSIVFLFSLQFARYQNVEKVFIRWGTLVK